MHEGLGLALEQDQKKDSVFLVWATQTPKGICTDFGEFADAVTARKAGVSLVHCCKATNFVIIKGRMIHPDKGEAYAIQDTGRREEEVSQADV